ncbi:hypothetical protein GCM10027184_17330 [Saccharothrix stipae]
MLAHFLVAGCRCLAPDLLGWDFAAGAQNRDSEREARLAAFGWPHRCTTRRHSHLGQKSPIDYENTLTPTPTTLTHAA